MFIPLSDNRTSKIYKNENSIIENLAASKYVCVQYVCTERETNAIINDIGFVYFACSEVVSFLVLQKSKQVCVSKLLSAKKEK